jgi:hypothetical protein
VVSYGENPVGFVHCLKNRFMIIKLLLRLSIGIICSMHKFLRDSKKGDKLKLNIFIQIFHEGAYVNEEKTKQIAELDDTMKHFMKVMHRHLSWK